LSLLIENPFVLLGVVLIPGIGSALYSLVIYKHMQQRGEI